jgi:BirA family transcriptional regulator, biotin operon repressor / biotin---[acetyl-CoA-carboxylase] ligase
MNTEFTILRFDEIESTSDLAFQMAKEGTAKNYLIITANSQTKGRGRQDRSWESPIGNLYFSLILQPEKSDLVTNYSFLMACVIGDVLKLYDVETQYKWPNDIMLNGKKLAGVLLQFQKINNVDNLVIGVGLNLVSCPDYAASLVGKDISKDDFLSKFTKIFAEYERKYQQFGFMTIRERWKSKAYKIGEQVKLSGGEVGVFKDIDIEGNLLLEGEGGKVERVVVAEIL